MFGGPLLACVTQFQPHQGVANWIANESPWDGCGSTLTVSHAPPFGLWTSLGFQTFVMRTRLRTGTRYRTGTRSTLTTTTRVETEKPGSGLGWKTRGITSSIYHQHCWGLCSLEGPQPGENNSSETYFTLHGSRCFFHNSENHISQMLSFF